MSEQLAGALATLISALATAILVLSSAYARRLARGGSKGRHARTEDDDDADDDP